MTGGNSPGIAADARMILRTSSRRSRILAGSDGADVPDDELAGIEIGGRDQQEPTFPIFLGDALKDALRQIFGDGPREGCRIHHRVVVDGRH